MSAAHCTIIHRILEVDRIEACFPSAYGQQGLLSDCSAQRSRLSTSGAQHQLAQNGQMAVCHRERHTICKPIWQMSYRKCGKF